MRAIAFSGGKESTILMFKYWQKDDIVFTITEQKPFQKSLNI